MYINLTMVGRVNKRWFNVFLSKVARELLHNESVVYIKEKMSLQ